MMCELHLKCDFTFVCAVVVCFCANSAGKHQHFYWPICVYLLMWAWSKYRIFIYAITKLCESVSPMCAFGMNLDYFGTNNSKGFRQTRLVYSSSIGTTAHCGLWPVQQCPSIFAYLPPTLSIFSLPALEDLFLLLFPSFPGSPPSSLPFQPLS